MSLLDDLAELARRLNPECCPRCLMPSADGFCDACRDDFARIAAPCPRCGLPRPCRRCPGRSPAWTADAVRAPFAYCAPLAACVQTLKYARQRRLGAALGRLLAAELGRTSPGCDVLIPVPLHPGRLRQRGFNQADEIARPLARLLGLPLLTRGIRRRLATPPQTGRDRPARQAGLDGAFGVEAGLAGLRAAVVDDVITTGATVNALAGALKAAGAARVEAWALARTTGRAVAADHSSR